MSTYISSIILGLTQGLTEFLPVSSSGHLVIVKRILSFSSPGALFEAILHMGTVLAIIFVYRKRILSLKIENLKLLLVATIPAGLVGILLQTQIEALFSSTKLVGLALIVTAYINYSVDKNSGKREKMDNLDSFAVGLAQAFAIIPGISRSGATILAARKGNISPEVAAEFSFLLSIPAILGANVLEFYSHGFSGDIDFLSITLGFISAFISGVFAITLVIKLLNEKKFKYFSVYCLVVGLISLILI